MWLINTALRRPFTILVAVIGVALGSVLAVTRMPVDIFPNLNLPVIYVAQPYGGMDPAQMESFLTSYYEYHFLYVSGIEHVESRSIQNVALLKLFFHPGADMSQALAQVISYVERSKAFMPPGTVNPFVMRFDAGSVPVGQLVFSSETRGVGEIQDLALFRVRPVFSTLPGVSAPPPFGGNQRTVIIRVDPDRLRSFSMSPEEVAKAVAAGNAILPAGNVRTGDLNRLAPMNGVVRDIRELADLPIRAGAGPNVYVRDVGVVENGSDILTGYGLVNGRRTVYIPVTKRAEASTLDVVNRVKAELPRFQSLVPEDIKVSFELDQSPIVKNSIRGLIFEGALGALLTGLMVLLFLRDLRSALIVVTTIPFAILAGVVGLWLAGQTINIMTLGGLALAVGILVDESTVAVENIHTHLSRGAAVRRAVWDATRETITPRLLAMLAVLAVFAPSLFMAGVARSLFVPLSLAVGFAMLASYVLSNTLVPVLSAWLLREKLGVIFGAPPSGENGSDHKATPPEGGAPKAFDRARVKYKGLLQRLWRLRWPVMAVYAAVALAGAFLVGRNLGLDIFPQVDTGIFQLRLRAPAGTRVERTEAIAVKALETVSREAGANNVDLTLGYIGTQPASYPVNTIHLWTSGPHEAVLTIALKRGAGIRLEEFKERLRRKLPEEIPGVALSFEAGDLISKVMNFGAPTPIEVAVSGPNLSANRVFADRVMAEMKKIPIMRDLQFDQALDYPTVDIKIDRARAGQLGVTVEQIGRSLVAATSSSRFTQPVYWRDPASGTAYQVQVEIPQSRIASIEDVQSIPVNTAAGARAMAGDVAEINFGTAVGEYDRYNQQRMVTIIGNVEGADLGSAAREAQSAIERAGEVPRGVRAELRGQVPPMRQTQSGLQLGLLLAIVAVFLLLTANFQSLRASLAILSTVPAVVLGVAVALWITGATLNVQSFMGAIMAVGVSVSNAILLVTFAEQRRREGQEADAAAIQGAQSRLRPILMTSFAMIAGMIPMALGIGEGSEQTAPLGRAVIGGLAASTIAVLTVLPLVFGAAQRRASRASASLHPDDDVAAR
ncbi:MAG TPA: efflux RND transporter permease subunit [Blastocatellia bacterium]|jgi:multidrug efflux pump subunit AcrB|nr:efflux RND transporter permease subunit [Blastocatellia bacterium]